MKSTLSSRALDVAENSFIRILDKISEIDPDVIPCLYRHESLIRRIIGETVDIEFEMIEFGYREESDLNA